MPIRRTLKNVVKNYSDAQIKVREATSNDPWGPSSTLMLEVADLTYNVLAFSEIMQMVWKRLNDHGKNWRHVYKALVLLDYIVKTGSEKVAQQCKDNIFAIQTLKDFQFVEDNQDHGQNVREKAKQLVSLLKDEDRLKNERAKAVKARERFAQSSTGATTTGTKTSPTLHTSTFAELVGIGTGGYSEFGSPSLSSLDNTLEGGAAGLDSDLEAVRPATSGEEELQLQLALAMSKEEHDEEVKRLKGDEVKLQMALEESRREQQLSEGLYFSESPADSPSLLIAAAESMLSDAFDGSLTHGSASMTRSRADKNPSPIHQYLGPSLQDHRSTDPWATATLLGKTGGAWGAEVTPPLPEKKRVRANLCEPPVRTPPPLPAESVHNTSWRSEDEFSTHTASGWNGNTHGQLEDQAIKSPWGVEEIPSTLSPPPPSNLSTLGPSLITNDSQRRSEDLFGCARFEIQNPELSHVNQSINQMGSAAGTAAAAKAVAEEGFDALSCSRSKSPAGSTADGAFSLRPAEQSWRTDAWNMSEMSTTLSNQTHQHNGTRKKSPADFLGDSASLVNLDNLVARPSSSLSNSVPYSVSATNPFMSAGVTADNRSQSPAAKLTNNPFAVQQVTPGRYTPIGTLSSGQSSRTTSPFHHQITSLPHQQQLQQLQQQTLTASPFLSDSVQPQSFTSLSPSPFATTNQSPFAVSSAALSVSPSPFSATSSISLSPFDATNASNYNPSFSAVNAAHSISSSKFVANNSNVATAPFATSNVTPDPFSADPIALSQSPFPMYSQQTAGYSIQPAAAQPFIEAILDKQPNVSETAFTTPHISSYPANFNPFLS